MGPGALILRGGVEVMRGASDLIQVHPVVGLISCAVFIAWFLQEGIAGKAAFFTYIHMSIYFLGATLSLSASVERLLLCCPLLAGRVESVTLHNIRQLCEPACFFSIGLL